MKIKWNGHASFTITADDGTVMVIDPYNPGGYGGVLTYDVVRDKADAVLVSHDHDDHNYVKGLPGSPQVVKGPGQVRDIKINGIDTFHDESNGSERGSNMVFSFKVDGIDICFLGDLGHQLSSEQIDAIGNVNLLLVPVGGTFTVDAYGAVKLIEALKPNLVIPMHYKTAKCDLPIAEVDDFLMKMENVKRLGQSEIELTAEKIHATGPEVLIMNHAC
jgi:L-ascorbate metabolism protein UlaG (beta-lactamase superfamily)